MRWRANPLTFFGGGGLSYVQYLTAQPKRIRGVALHLIFYHLSSFKLLSVTFVA